MASRTLKTSIIIISAGIIAVLILYETGLTNKCSISQLGIVSDLKKYQETKDPELCAQLNDKITQFNGQCKGDMEELDCG